MSDLNPGLEGVLVAETRLSRIDGERGDLVIGGFPLAELAGNATFEETVFLLRNDRLPTRDELADLRDRMAAHRGLADETRATLRAAAADGQDAMDALRMGAAAASLGRGTTEADPERDSLRAIAAFPTIVATYWRYRQGDDLVAPRTDLGHAANYLYMLTGDEPTDDAVRGLETYLNSVVDHGLNASTFTARAIVSTESDVVSAVTGAVGSLKGPLHGGAPGPVLEMLLDAHESGDPEAVVRETLDAGERLMGFGHRVYQVRDPRAAVLSDAAERFYGDSDAGSDDGNGDSDAGNDDGNGDSDAGSDAGDGDGDTGFFETAREFERVGVELLDEHKPGRRLETNVEFYTAVLHHGIGIPRELFTATFGVARVGGWTAHCLEQLEDNRIVRPRGRYVGAEDRTWTPLGDR